MPKFFVLGKTGKYIMAEIAASSRVPLDRKRPIIICPMTDNHDDMDDVQQHQQIMIKNLPREPTESIGSISKTIIPLLLLVPPPLF